jgi:hypothetical protein
MPAIEQQGHAGRCNDGQCHSARRHRGRAS